MKVDRTVQLAGGRVSLAPDDGVFAIAGTEPAWIWVHTCPTPGCSCRTALVLATNESRDVLLARGAVVREAWNAGTGYAEAAAQLEGLVVFDVDIDTAEAFLPNQREPLDLARNPPIGDIVARIDGELLDAIGRLWYRGKSLPDPEQQALLAEQVIIRGWQPGDLLAWDDACTGVRQDFFVLDGRVYEAAEMYCPVPGCECGEVVVHFETLIPRGAPSPGGVLVQRSGAAEFEPGKNGQARLEQLWAAFRKRHPGYLVRFARRYPAMKTIGARIAAKPVAGPPKVGRNDPCPCGSGKKHKKCCAASSTR